CVRPQLLQPLTAPVVGDAKDCRRILLQLCVAAEEEQPIAEDLPCQKAAYALLAEGCGFIEIIGPAVREGSREWCAVECRVAEERIASPLKAVGAAACDDVQDAARGGTELCGERVGHHLKFLNPVLYQGERLFSVVLPLRPSHRR